jgi:hypothetical protein
MTLNEARAVEMYFDSGYLISIIDTPYVDSLVMAVYNDEETGELVYDSETFSQRELKEVDLSEVIIAKPLEDITTDINSIEGLRGPGEYSVEKVDGREIQCM